MPRSRRSVILAGSRSASRTRHSLWCTWPVTRSPGFQYLRTPNAIHDAHRPARARGAPASAGGHAPSRWQRLVYVSALHRLRIEDFLDAIVAPVLVLARLLDRADTRAAPRVNFDGTPDESRSPRRLGIWSIASLILGRRACGTCALVSRPQLVLILLMAASRHRAIGRVRIEPPPRSPYHAATRVAMTRTGAVFLLISVVAAIVAASVCGGHIESPSSPRDIYRTARRTRAAPRRGQRGCAIARLPCNRSSSPR